MIDRGLLPGAGNPAPDMSRQLVSWLPLFSSGRQSIGKENEDDLFAFVANDRAQWKWTMHDYAAILFLVYQQILPSLEPVRKEIKVNTSSDAPKVPVYPKQVQPFAKAMNSYMEEEAARRAAAIEEAEGR